MVGAVGRHALDSPCSRVLSNLDNSSERKRPARFVCQASDGCGRLRTAEYSSDDLEMHMLRRIYGQRSPDTRVYRHRAADEAGASVASDHNKSFENEPLVSIFRNGSSLSIGSCLSSALW